MAGVAAEQEAEIWMAVLEGSGQCFGGCVFMNRELKGFDDFGIVVLERKGDVRTWIALKAAKGGEAGGEAVDGHDLWLAGVALARVGRDD